jgi:hypothetical protein
MSGISFCVECAVRSVIVRKEMTPKSCNLLAFASQYRHESCVGFTIFMRPAGSTLGVLNEAQLRLR